MAVVTVGAVQAKGVLQLSNACGKGLGFSPTGVGRAEVSVEINVEKRKKPT